MSATPRPWSTGIAGPCNIVYFDGADIVGVAHARSQANADLIVRAVNAHDALVDLGARLCDLVHYHHIAMLQSDEPDCLGRDEGIWEAALSLHKALRLARGET